MWWYRTHPDSARLFVSLSGGARVVELDLAVLPRAGLVYNSCGADDMGIVAAVRAEYVRYQALAEAAIDQLADADLSAAGPGDSNSIAAIVWHLSGNFQSRFTDFLTSDGEKPWRRREEEFERRTVTRDELLATWRRGWDVLFATLDTLSDADLDRVVTIRQQPLTVVSALERSLAHASYHVGQIVYMAKATRGADWRYLSIPPGTSEAYNRAPKLETPEAHSETLKAPDHRC